MQAKNQIEDIFRDASSIHKTRSHMSSIKSKQKPSDELVIPNRVSVNVALTEGSLKGFDDPTAQGGAPSFLEKCEIQ